MAGAFFQSVYEVVARIPYGRVLCYGDIARMIGYPNRARFVGFAMRACPDRLPWHRVVMADGSIAGGDFAPLRRALLEREGVPFLPDGRVDLRACRAALPPDR
ncbi:MAG: MGMT family protein [Clostridia bacterium]|nr:MGMT family protein [Clostridia bacterium]